MRHWTVDGYDLTQAAHNIREIPQGIGFPGRRGENITVPFRDGSRYVRKALLERQITLGMQVFGEENIDTINQLFGREGLMVVTAETEGETRQIQCEAKNPIWHVIEIEDYAKFTVDLLAPDPHWYALTKTEKTITVDETPLNTEGGETLILTNPGTAPTRKAIITATGVISDLKIENKTTETWVRWSGDLAASTLIIDVGGYSAELGGDNVAGLITHAGDPSFLVIAAGDNELEITTENDPPDGTVKIEFYAPYF